MAEAERDLDVLDLIVRIATGGRRIRPYVGKLPGGRKMWGGARPAEQVAAVVISIVTAVVIAAFLHQKILPALGIGTVLGFGLAAALHYMPYDESVPPLNALIRLAALLTNRKPIVLHGDEADSGDSADSAYPFVVGQGENPFAEVEAAFQ